MEATKSSHRTVVRDVPGTVVPSGDQATIPKGTAVTITHRLGGNFTVTCEWGMFRIAGKDADAIGEAIPEVVAKLASLSEGHEGAPDEGLMWDQLKTVYDPEIPVSIVDLGLVYSMDVAEEDGLYKALVCMTLTAPGCGMGPAIAADAKDKLMMVPGVSDALVELVWDPPWSQEMISEEGKMELGLI